MSKRAIGTLYVIAIILIIIALNVFDYMVYGYGQMDRASGVEIFLGICSAIIGGILFMIVWISTLVNLSRGQQWAMFVLTFFFGGIMVFLYLVSGPPVPREGQIPQTMAPPLPGPYLYQPQPSALDVLHMRLARGEIDEQTYQRLRAML